MKRSEILEVISEIVGEVTYSNLAEKRAIKILNKLEELKFIENQTFLTKLKNSISFIKKLIFPKTTKLIMLENKLKMIKENLHDAYDTPCGCEIIYSSPKHEVWKDCKVHDTILQTIVDI